MKTAEEKAREFIGQYFGASIYTMEKQIILLLKEQDRSTRHACAEAVIQCEEDVSGECIWKDDAHNACMNVKAV